METKKINVQRRQWDTFSQQSHKEGEPDTAIMWDLLMWSGQVLLRSHSPREAAQIIREIHWDDPTVHQLPIEGDKNPAIHLRCSSRLHYICHISKANMHHWPLQEKFASGQQERRCTFTKNAAKTHKRWENVSIYWNAALEHKFESDVEICTYNSCKDAY